ncbi:myb-like protein P isoform X1 [Drosophila novamexicana]|uniref:myb-like protein P isoform X1 n=1 Tax=Drosophila novamexicana TaxID=47314 RepID=UPI0011E5C166|nr:myb-like protein P isoform X1 [Drosophila novamexicana]
MDILDIDEALKDDSYIFLADKTHDDISNILQQWKTNNQQQSQMQPQLHSQPNNEQAYKLNSKTFTRPKRRSQAAANLETQFTHVSQTENNTSPTTNSGSLMLSLEIGGLVTNMHKSFLQDTSPPSSICTSISNGCMNSSLISSADFTNLNFLQSINSLEPTESDPADHNLTTTATLINEGGYTLSDMIRDRKALESLSMSGDGTLIKDSHIGQIDDISLTTLSKTASGCSTMDNSTDSVSMPNEIQVPAQAHTHAQSQLCTTMVLSEEMIGDTTFSLVDSLTSRTTTESMCEGETTSTFKRPTAINTTVLNETQLLAGRQINSTFTENCHTPEAARCDTPENLENKLSSVQMQSTPLTTASGRSQYNSNNNNNNNKPLSYTPTLKGRDEVINISPIVGSTTPHKSRQQLNHTYEPPTAILKDLQLEVAPDGFNSQQFVANTMQLLEQIEQPTLDATYNKSEEHRQMQCVMDLAEAEVELLAQQGDEEQFEHMLAELGKVNALNAEQLKMQKSLDSIKRRFHKDEEPYIQPEQQQQQIVDLQHVTPPSAQSQLTSSHSQSSSSSERLLSRRSRLYDDVNLSAMHNSDTSNASCNSTSFIVHRREEEPAKKAEVYTPLHETDKQEADMEGEKQEASSYKVTGRRNRDRERFKTIKITKEMRARDEELGNIVVPCIDDEEPQNEPLDTVKSENRQESFHGRLSRLDQTSLSNINDVGNNTVSGSNYLTYKKPKEKSLLMHQQQQQQPQSSLAESGQNARPQPRSLSRPRYISGLQKLSTVSKATSAGAGLNATTLANSKATTESVPKASDFEGLKSPMGIKSKSFHNLSSNISGFVSAGGTVDALAPRPSLGGALRRPSVQVSKLTNLFRATQQHEQDGTSVFKVPKLVSGLRAPTNAGVKRTVGNGLARPSSGYYSLSVKAAGESETPESLSSASSRGSLYGKDTKPNDPFDTQALSLKLTQVTTGATGIPKPSGLRQPTQMKRSGLPRPSSILRR